MKTQIKTFNINKISKLAIASILIISSIVNTKIVYADDDATLSLINSPYTSYYNDIKDTQVKFEPVYRIYNPYTGEHLYIKDETEKNNDIKAGWRDEGIAWYTRDSKYNGIGKALYRLYNKYVPGGDHYYTTDYEEYRSLIKAGWEGEQTVMRVEDSPAESVDYKNTTVAVYQQYNPYATTGTHNYTTSTTENSNLKTAGWRTEGSVFYVFPKETHTHQWTLTHRNNTFTQSCIKQGTTKVKQVICGGCNRAFADMFPTLADPNGQMTSTYPDPQKAFWKAQELHGACASAGYSEEYRYPQINTTEKIWATDVVTCSECGEVELIYCTHGEEIPESTK